MTCKKWLKINAQKGLSRPSQCRRQSVVVYDKQEVSLPRIS
jgi:hypothetical protein